MLILKIKNASYTGDFRLISVCNVVHKIIAKVLPSRFKKFLGVIIDESQSGFVPGRLTSNAFIAFEAFHPLQQARSESGNYMTVKFDISNNYDKVE